MYNPLLDTLIAVADCGSLTKAAERLYISSTAVMKQINALENHLESVSYTHLDVYKRQAISKYELCRGLQ